MPFFRPCIVAAALTVAAPAVAALLPQDDAEGQLINAPNVQDWSVYGDGQTHQLKTDKAVQGGGAMIVEIPAKPAHAWDIGASTPITGAIRKGDELVFAFWVRAEAGGTDRVSTIQAVVQASDSPYTPAISGDIDVTGEWTLVHIKGVSPQDFAAGKANAALSIGTAAQTLALGPAFVLDLGPAKAG